jgi:hypothetical protein
MPELMKGLGVSVAGKTVMKWEQFERRTVHALSYGNPARKFRTVGKPLIAASVIGLGLALASVLLRQGEKNHLEHTRME